MLNRIHIALTVATLLILILAGTTGHLQIQALKQSRYEFDVITAKELRIVDDAGNIVVYIRENDGDEEGIKG